MRRPPFQKVTMLLLPRGVTLQFGNLASYIVIQRLPDEESLIAAKAVIARGEEIVVRRRRGRILFVYRRLPTFSLEPLHSTSGRLAEVDLVVTGAVDDSILGIQ